MTKTDLSQIRTIFKEEIRDEVKKVVEDVLEQKLEQKIEPIREQLKSLKPMSKKIVAMDKKINNLQEGQNTILKYIDEQDIRLEKRVNRIENHLHFSSSALQ
jgi:hypothetical protein